jgi:hypothetical protein
LAVALATAAWTLIGGEYVALETIEIERNLSRIRGREARTQSIATRFTRAEERALLKRAEACGQNLREWAREVLLHAAIDGSPEQLGRYIFTELVGLQMLLMGSLEPLLSGERLTREEIAVRFRQVQKSKAAQADELLSRRTQTQEKQS